MNFYSKLLIGVLITLPAIAMERPATLKTKISIVQGDITKQPTKAIVNAANVDLKHGSGIAGAIRKAAGDQLQSYCDKLPKKYNGHRLEVGGALRTPSFDLQKNGIQYIIHTAGPDCRKKDQKENAKQLLKKSYISSLKCAHEKNIHTTSFPSISTGVFGFDSKEAAKIAVRAIFNYAKKHPTHFTEIRLVAFDAGTKQMYEAELKKLIEKKPSKNKSNSNNKKTKKK